MLYGGSDSLPVDWSVSLAPLRFLSLWTRTRLSGECSRSCKRRTIVSCSDGSSAFGNLSLPFYFYQPLVPSGQTRLATLGEIALDIGVELVSTTTSPLSAADCGFQYSTPVERRLEERRGRVVEDVNEILEQVVRILEVNVVRS